MTAPRVPRNREESALLARIRLAIGPRRDMLITRINTGVYVQPGKPTARVRSAPNGFPDIIGTQIRRILHRKVQEHTFGRHEADVWVTYGQAIAIETKSRKGELSDEQRLWRQAFEKVGGIYIVARDVVDVEVVLGPVPSWVV